MKKLHSDVQISTYYLELQVSFLDLHFKQLGPKIGTQSDMIHKIRPRCLFFASDSRLECPLRSWFKESPSIIISVIVITPKKVSFSSCSGHFLALCATSSH